MLKLLIPVALLSALLPNAAVARDQANADIHVTYRDLDLRSAAGVKQLDRRIEKAAAAVCPDPAETDLARKLEVARCRAVARAKVADQRALALRYGAHRNAELAATPAYQ